MASVSDFNSKGGFMVRSKGGRVCCGFNSLPIWAKGSGAFQAHESLSRWMTQTGTKSGLTPAICFRRS